MLQTGSVDCPVCGRSFSASFVNEHANKCLNSQDIELQSNGGSGQHEKGMLANSLLKGNTKSPDGSTVKKSKNEKASNSWFGNTSPPTNALKRSSSNLAGKASTDSSSKRLKLHQNGQETQNKVTEELLSLQHSSSPSLGQKKGIEHNKGQKSKSSQFTPLAERMRPKTLAEYVGQTQAVGNNSLLRTLLEADEIPSMIFWGPPGCGKTTLAHIIANSARINGKARFVQLSATTSGINDVKEVVKVARNEQQMFKRKTILFVDEIHRFNKLQQDTFLPHVENGTITLIGATTENPSFQLNNALLSRCRVVVLEKLTVDHVEQILRNAVNSLGMLVGSRDSLVTNKRQASSDGDLHVVIEENAIKTLANLCDGDARIALNGLQLAIQSQVATVKQKPKKQDTKELNGSPSSQQNPSPNIDADPHGDDEELVYINVSHIKEGLQKTHLLYDRNGEEHYNIISALHKSIRGSDENAALYWLARMLVGGEDPLYVARRLVRFASEDVGLADPQALNHAVASYQACHFIGMPECDVILAQAVVYLSRAPKSIEIFNAYSEAKKCVRSWEGPQPTVPLHIRNAPTKLMKSLGYSAGYKYNPSFDGPVDQTYLPPEVQGVDFFTWSKNKSGGNDV